MQSADPLPVFGIHEHPHLKCPVGGTIQAVLEDEFQAVQSAMETALRDLTLTTVLNDIARRQL